MSRPRLSMIATFVALGTLGACAGPDPKVEEDVYRAPVYRTGSKIPAWRESGAPATELTPSERRALEDMQNKARIPVGPANK